jgi:hypothetical protein
VRKIILEGVDNLQPAATYGCHGCSVAARWLLQPWLLAVGILGFFFGNFYSFLIYMI